MLAMDVNDDAGILNARSALRFFASLLAPTGDGIRVLFPAQPSCYCTVHKAQAARIGTLI